MYTRSYDEEKLTLPNSYGGTAFSESKSCSEKEELEAVSQNSPPIREDKLSSSLFQLFTPVAKLFGKDGIRMPKIGTEELILLATAAFLLFGKEHDIECALLLVFLIFIT
jgi:hypothetical protein